MVNLSINYMAIGVAVLVNFIIGGIWYGPLLGKAWVKEIDPSGRFAPSRKDMIRGMILMIIGSILTAYVLAHTTQIWRPSVWGVGADEAPWVYGLSSAIFTWLGFYAPVQLNLVGFELRSWKFFMINSGYHIISLISVAMILSYWK